MIHLQDLYEAGLRTQDNEIEAASQFHNGGQDFLSGNKPDARERQRQLGFEATRFLSIQTDLVKASQNLDNFAQIHKLGPYQEMPKAEMHVEGWMFRQISRTLRRHGALVANGQARIFIAGWTQGMERFLTNGAKPEPSELHRDPETAARSYGRHEGYDFAQYLGRQEARKQQHEIEALLRDKGIDPFILGDPNATLAQRRLITEARFD